MAINTSPSLGVKLNASDTVQQVPLGTVVDTSDGGRAVYCIASGAVSQYALCGINEDFDIYMMTSTLAAQSDRLGFPQVAIAAGSYGWAHLNGSNIKVRTKASAATDTQLWTTASAGVVDDATAAGALKIDGVVLVAAASTAANGAAGIECKAAWPAIRES
jgi:hypothetical protein